MKYLILFAIVLACANNLVQSLPVDETIPDVSRDKLKSDIEKLFEKLEIEVPEDLKFPPWVKRRKIIKRIS